MSVTISRFELPRGLSTEMSIKAVRTIEEWEEDPDKDALDLAVELFLLFSPPPSPADPQESEAARSGL